MAQLCLWNKIRIKQYLVFSASAFQCMPAGFLCPKCDNFAYLHTRQDENELQLKRCFFFAKIGVVQARTIFLRRKDKINYLSNQTRKTLDGGPYIIKF